MGKDINTEKSRPGGVSFGKFGFDTILSGVLFLVEHGAHVDKLYQFLDPDYFYVGDESARVKGLRFLIKVLLSMQKRFGSSGINHTSFSQVLQQTPDSEAADTGRLLYEQMVVDPKFREIATDRVCQSIFLDFLKVAQIIKWSEKFMPQYKTGQIEDAVKSMKDLTATTDQIRFSDMNETVDASSLSFQDLGAYLSANTNPTSKDVFLLGQNEIDSSLGGFERRTLNLFMGATNSGKSMLTHHLIRRCVEQQMFVHVTFVEDRPKSVIRRLYSALTGIPSNDLKYNWKNLPPEKVALIENAKAQVARYVKLEFGYGESLDSIHQKKIEYDMERAAKGLAPYDVDIVDYSGHIADKALGDKMYEKYRNAFANRKDFCLVNNKVGFDFAQVNREGFRKKQNTNTVNHGDLAGAFDLSQVCDNIIAINRTPEHEKKHEAYLAPTKVKDGEVKPDGYRVLTQFECARWVMNPQEAEVFNNTLPEAEVLRAI